MTDLLYLLLTFTFVGIFALPFLAYGDEIKQFGSIPDAMLALWRQMLGDLHLVDQMMQTNRVLGPLFFVVFTSSVSIVLLTLFLGLLRESYVLADDQNGRMGLVQAFLESAIAPYLGLVQDYTLRNDEASAALDALVAQEALEGQVEREDLKGIKGWDKDHVEQRAQKAAQKREGRKDILLQSLLTLSREARVISRRVDTLMDSDAPNGAELPEFFD
eukprot:CAMPEP_0179457084 /NCGR_PEP_ID=MMETSP0799-20121207/40953_1 /TAXON_ID=46947 /ORGANISM="Geminigera cryophila, Strain CCMP2564" /LENGTH=216 /DNA_ID=CAMNT_0021257619 /DNA_START=82 /DNA_END=733 /DNA_ORIENTATION=-